MFALTVNAAGWFLDNYYNNETNQVVTENADQQVELILDIGAGTVLYFVNYSSVITC